MSHVQILLDIRTTLVETVEDDYVHSRGLEYSTRGSHSSPPFSGTSVKFAMQPFPLHITANLAKPLSSKVFVETISLSFERETLVSKSLCRVVALALLKIGEQPLLLVQKLAYEARPTGATSP